MRPAQHVRTMIRNWNKTTSAEMDQQVLADITRALAAAQECSAPDGPHPQRRPFWNRAGYLVAASLILVSWAVCLVSYRTIATLRSELQAARSTIDSRPAEDSATINLYLTEHQQAVVRNASLDTTAPPPALHMRLSQEDFLYYELFDHPESTQPGIIFRGPPALRNVEPSDSPTISNGHALTLSEARQTSDFAVVSPSWLRPCYRLEELRRIEGRDALQLLYTNGIDSVSLFEQPLNGQRGLQPQDFREYVVYRNQGQTGGAILIWRDDVRVYTLVGNAEISQLMDMAQSINAAR